MVESFKRLSSSILGKVLIINFKTQKIMKKYFYVWISLHSGEKTANNCVKDFAFHCTEERLHEICFSILQNMEKTGMTFNGKNENRYFELNSRECPSPNEIGNEIQKLLKK